MDLEQLKFPIGKFEKPTATTPEQLQQWIESLRTFPEKLEKTLQNVDNHQLQWQYRPESWTVLQLVHHCADSHMNAFIRMKLALTEKNPTIKPYDENAWAVLPDSLELPFDTSLQILKGLHHRWVILLENLSDETLQATFFHPEHQQKFSIAENIAMYAWHANHHLAQIQQALTLKQNFLS